LIQGELTPVKRFTGGARGGTGSQETWTKGAGTVREMGKRGGGWKVGVPRWRVAGEVGKNYTTLTLYFAIKKDAEVNGTGTEKSWTILSSPCSKPDVLSVSASSEQICSGEGLTLEMSAFQSLYSDQITLCK